MKMSQLFYICAAFVVYLALTDVTSNASPSEVKAPELLKIKVYYETRCGDSKNFIRNQLKYAMDDMDWLQYTDLQFVPYGKVSVSNNHNVSTLHCQHGNRECEQNALHACIIENNNIEEQFKMITCLMSNWSLDIDKCAQNLKIDVSAAKTCKETRLNFDILKKYGDDTNKLEFMTFVPSITIDGEFNPSDQYDILYYFGEIFCRKYNEKYSIKLKNCP